MNRRKIRLNGLTALIALVALISGAVVWVVQTNNSTTVEIELPAAPPIMVEIAGEVNTPGVYELTEGARVGDLLLAAGGATLCGDVDEINSAAPLADGQKVVVGNLEININTASLETLQKLNRIGEVLAQRIVDARPFAEVDDLERVAGIGPTTLSQIKSSPCRVVS